MDKAISKTNPLIWVGFCVAVIITAVTIRWYDSRRLAKAQSDLQVEIHNVYKYKAEEAIYKARMDTLQNHNVRLTKASVDLLSRLNSLNLTKQTITNNYSNLYENIRHNSGNDSFQYSLLQRLLAEHQSTAIAR